MLTEIDSRTNEMLKRVQSLLVAFHSESQTLHNAPQEEKARTLAFMKVKLTEWIIHIWPNRSAFEVDIAILESLITSPTEEANEIP